MQTLKFHHGHKRQQADIFCVSTGGKIRQPQVLSATDHCDPVEEEGEALCLLGTSRGAKSGRWLGTAGCHARAAPATSQQH
ncbi:hypothetical protein BaRGS_00011472 [Batillaria attramentaria]|uniref:Uncharacterized protein n=1 Tax=Batillaria attramentaria TaxID=370345 RepID=A0ABD0LD56_9CAEN